MKALPCSPWYQIITPAISTWQLQTSKLALDFVGQGITRDRHLFTSSCLKPGDIIIRPGLDEGAHDCAGGVENIIGHRFGGVYDASPILEKGGVAM